MSIPIVLFVGTLSLTAILTAIVNIVKIRKLKKTQKKLLQPMQRKNTESASATTNWQYNRIVMLAQMVASTTAEESKSTRKTIVAKHVHNKHMGNRSFTASEDIQWNKDKNKSYSILMYDSLRDQNKNEFDKNKQAIRELTKRMSESNLDCPSETDNKIDANKQY